MATFYKWFVAIKQGGYVDFVSVLVDGYQEFFEFPSTLWHNCLNIDVNHVELIDALGHVHKVKMEKEYGEPVCSFSCPKWVNFISRFSPMKPKFIHLDQVDMKTFLVNFYTNEGNEIEYRYTKDHLSKCLVVGCHDPTMYQPVPHDLFLNSRSGRGGKYVEIAFNGVVSRIRLYWSVLSRLRKPAVVAFTDSEWERVVVRESFSSSKVIVVSSDKYGGSLAGKILDGVLHDIDMDPPAPVVSEKVLHAAFGSCAVIKGYMSIPSSFHEHKITGEFREIWLNAGGRSLYMCAKIHTDKQLKSKKNKNVLLVGEMDRLKEALDLVDGFWMRFVLVSGDVSSHDDALFFNVFKLN